MTDSTETRYRVVGTNRHGEVCVTEQSSARSALRAADDANRRAAKQGWPTDWRVETAEVEWKPLEARA